MNTENLWRIIEKRGFIFPSSEIYGRVSGFYDYGNMGTKMKLKWENSWRKYFIGLDNNFHEISTCEIMPKKVFAASGHLKNFVDPLTTCKKCKSEFRADHLIEENLKIDAEGFSSEELTQKIFENKIKCPKCKGDLSEVEVFNMMFPVNVGATKEINAYLRPESAQGPYVSFKRMFEVTRKKIPMGLGMIGRVFRNEISPRQGVYRMREFSQAELQIFFDYDKINEHEKFGEVEKYKLLLFPLNNRESKKVEEISCKDALKILPKFYVYYMAKVQQFYLEVLGVTKEKFRFKELSEKERAFYNKYHWDIEVNIESFGGFKEVGGVHYRTDHDLGGHQKGSGEKMEIFYEGKKFVPHVLELSFGVDRNVYMLLDLAYKQDGRGEFLDLGFGVAPVNVAVFPLVNKDGLNEKAEEIYKNLKEFDIFYDDRGSIGRRYARADEVGVPFCITVDHQTLDDGTVTLRYRNTKEQVRIKIDELKDKLK